MENMGAGGMVIGGLEYVYAAYIITFCILGGYALLTLVWSRRAADIAQLEDTGDTHE